MATAPPAASISAMRTRNGGSKRLSSSTVLNRAPDLGRRGHHFTTLLARRRGELDLRLERRQRPPLDRLAVELDLDDLDRRVDGQGLHQHLAGEELAGEHRRRQDADHRPLASEAQPGALGGRSRAGLGSLGPGSVGSLDPLVDGSEAEVAGAPRDAAVEVGGDRQSLAVGVELETLGTAAGVAPGLDHQDLALEAGDGLRAEAVGDHPAVGEQNAGLAVAIADEDLRAVPVAGEDVEDQHLEPAREVRETLREALPGAHPGGSPCRPGAPSRPLRVPEPPLRPKLAPGAAAAGGDRLGHQRIEVVARLGDAYPGAGQPG
jgi:hypothetical protein